MTPASDQCVLLSFSRSRLHGSPVGLGLTAAPAARSPLLNGRPTPVTAAGRPRREHGDPEAPAAIEEQVRTVLGDNDKPDPSGTERDDG
jgi:hypothetical protein